MKNLLFLFSFFVVICAHAEEKIFNKLLVIEDPALKEKCRKNWNDHCQDLAIKELSGARWREVKEAILAFQKAVCENDLNKIYELIDNSLFYIAIGKKHNDIYRFDSIELDKHAIKENFNIISLASDPDEKKILCNRKYKDFEFFNPEERLFFSAILLSDNYGIAFKNNMPELEKLSHEAFKDAEFMLTPVINFTVLFKQNEGEINE